MGSDIYRLLGAEALIDIEECSTYSDNESHQIKNRIAFLGNKFAL